MAVLPGVPERRLPRGGAGIAQMQNVGAVGDAMAGAGATIAGVGNMILDREATAAAKERDAQVSEKIRALLYDPEKGYANLGGQAAVAARQRTIDQLEALRSEATTGLNRSAATKLEGSLTGRIERALNTVDTHASDQRRTWLDGASNARIEAAYQDSLANPKEIDASLGVITNELQGRALREGWDSAKLAVETANAKSKVYADHVTRVAATDPIRAMEILRANEKAMQPSDVANIEAKLAPAVKDAIGRARGRDAALGGVSPDYLAATRSAESGGNDAAANPNSSAVGRYQFLSGTWAQLMSAHPELGLTADGRTDPAQSELAMQAFTADNAKRLIGAGIKPTGGNLYAAHFLGVGGAVSVLSAADDTALDTLVAPGVIAANGFLSGMTAGDFKAWAQRKGGSDLGYSDAPDINRILDIADPQVRDAAVAEYKLRTGLKVAEAKAAQDAAANVAFQTIEAGGTVDHLPLDTRTALGQDAMSSLRAYERSVKTGVPVETDPAVYYTLRQKQAQDPSGFQSLNMMTFIDKLSKPDWDELVKLQTKPASDITATAASTLMEVASRHLKAAGINPAAKDGTDANKVAVVQTRLLQWQDAYIKENRRAPTQAEINTRVSQELLPVVIDPPGLGNKVRVNAFELGGTSLSETQIATGDITIMGEAVPREVVDETRAELHAEGIDVTAESLVARIMQKAFGQ